MSDRLVCEVCGMSCPRESAACARCGPAITDFARPTLDDRDGHGLSPAGFGFGPADVRTDLFSKAEACFLSSVSSEAGAAELGYRREDVAENDDAYYFPVGWIGCCGHLVTKDRLRLISFGSYIGPNAHLWAHYKGISLENLGKDRRNTLEILSVADREKTIRVLKVFLKARWVDTELSLDRSRLPAVVEDVDLYFGIRDLLDAEVNGWFKFEVR